MPPSFSALVARARGAAQAPANPTGAPGAPAPTNLAASLSKMSTKTPQEITKYNREHFELVDNETPDTSATVLADYNEIVRTGADPTDETAPWYLTRVNGALQLISGLDVTKPPTDLPNFLTASQFHTKSHCIIIGERTTAADT